MRYPTSDERTLWANPLYRALEDAGITLAQHANDPDRGWMITCTVGQFGPFSTVHEALVEGVEFVQSLADEQVYTGAAARWFALTGQLVVPGAADDPQLIVAGMHADDVADGEAGKAEIAERMRCALAIQCHDPHAYWRTVHVWEGDPAPA
jgi:hypothetical protein